MRRHRRIVRLAWASRPAFVTPALPYTTATVGGAIPQQQLLERHRRYLPASPSMRQVVPIGAGLDAGRLGRWNPGKLGTWPSPAPSEFQVSRFPGSRPHHPQPASTPGRPGTASPTSRCRYLLGCQRPALSRLCTCRTYAGGSGGHRNLCRVELQKRHAATMLVCESDPRAHRATRCSAVHLNRHASRSLRPRAEAKRSGWASHISALQ